MSGAVDNGHTSGAGERGTGTPEATVELPRTKSSLGALLTAARSRAGLSYRELARRSGVPTGTLQGWLGGRSLPTPALRDAFLDVIDLLGLVDGHTREEWWDAVEKARRVPGTGAGNPYVGLRPYAPEDRELFFGRDEELAELVGRVLGAAGLDGSARIGVVALLAPSGGGKSSLLGAGLVGTACSPGGALEGWYATLITPGEDPEARWRAAYVARLSRPEVPAVLVIDQFEELWTVATPERRTALLTELEATVPTGPAGSGTAPTGDGGISAPTVVVLGLRSDYFGAAAEVEALAPALGRAMLLRTVSSEQAERIITGPARLRGVTVDPGLVAVLQRDLSMGEGPWSGGALPLLSQALAETWDKAAGPHLTAADYLAVGGVAGAIDRTAERAYADLGDPEREMARTLMLRLVRVDLDTPVRRPLELDLLQDDERAWAVVERFARARLLTVGEDTVEIAHEALLQHWNRLRGWILEDMEDLRAQAYLGRAAALWAEHDRDSELLVPVERFGLGLRLEDAGTGERMLGSVDRDFVAASRAHFAARDEAQLRVNRRLRRRARAALSAFAIAAALAVLAGVALVNLLQTRNQALSRQTSLSSSLVAAQDPGLAAQIALGASELASTPEGTSALVTASGRHLPRRALGPTQPTKLAVDTGAGVLAQPGSDGTLRLWRGAAALGDADGTPEAVALDPARGSLQTGAVARAGQRTLVAAGGAGGVWLVDATTAPSRILATLATGIGTTYGLAFSPDGRTLYTGGQDGVIRRWDLSTPEAPRQLTPVDTQAGATYALAVTTAGTRLAAAGSKGVSRWALDGATPSPLPALGTDRGTQAVAFSPDGRSLVAGARGAKVYRWRLDGDTAAAQSDLTGFGSWINDLAFSPDGSRLLVASSDQTMREFDTSTGSQLRSYPHPAVVSAALYDGDHLVSAASDGTIRWWPLADPELGHFASGLFQVSADPSGTHLLATVEKSGEIAAWDLTDPARPRRLTGPVDPTGGVVGTAFHSPVTAVLGDGSGVLSGTSGGDMVVWHRQGDAFQRGQTVAVDPGQDISWLGSSADGTTVLADSYTSTKAFLLKRGPSATGSPSSAGSSSSADAYAVTAALDVKQSQALALSADGRRAVIGDAESHAAVWTFDDQGRVTGTAALPDLGSVGTAAVLSPDGRSAAIGTDAGQVVLYDLSNPAAPRRVAEESTALGAIYGLTASQDGKYLAAGAGDKRIWVWRWDRGALTPWAWIEASLDRVNDVRFIDNGTRLVGVGANGSINSWDVDLARDRRTVCQGRGAALTATEWAERLVGAQPRELC